MLVNALEHGIPKINWPFLYLRQALIYRMSHSSGTILL